ncbi:MAG: GTP pyrophosphokinase family protein [Deltaproteobacteria bacterium]|nr:GTP pyrophosphokinase family protein [Deltaproteobacteria bacterium]
MSTDALLEEFDQLVPALGARGEALARDLRERLARDPTLKIHSVAWRLKGRESLVRKLGRPDRSYSDLWALTDLVGVRVITYFADAVDRVGKIVESELPVDFTHSTDKRRRETTDFGYRSLHYVCRLGDPLPERACFELQVRTVLEHAWAEIEHDLGYKASEEIPAGVRRRLSRLAGLLELADQEFGEIRSDLERYARSLPARIETSGSSVALDRFSLAALLECAEVETLDSTIAGALQKELGEEPFYPGYLLKMLVASGVRTADDARRGAREHADAITSMVGPYFQLTESLWQLSPRQMDRIPRGYSLFFLAHLEVLRTASLRLEKIERLARLYRELDYPDDAKTAHDVAGKLVDAFEGAPSSTS